jgi:7,8-dihydropterin-6-yl-methyl-4-(beta-D-ribofuranosyl)aminobenzene 5'-phosphate synthase
MTLRITTLCENTAGTVDVVAEHGLSFLIEAGKTNILFDTGAEISVPLNAEAFGIDLSKVDKIILSHGHIDHTGGLGKVLEKINKKIDIFAHPDVWLARYSRSENGDRFIGIPYRREQMECMGAVFRLSKKPVKIAENIWTTGEVPMVTDFENFEPTTPEGNGWWIEAGGRLKPDMIPDDQAIVFKTKAGLVIILGCAHRGIINTIYYAQKITGVKKVYAVLGGAHLSDATEERLWQTIAVLRDLDVKKIGLCHCTGLPASVIMAQELGDRFFFNNTGSVTEIP